MFGLGFTELIVIFVVILVVFGPERLPELAKTMGRTAAQFRRTMDEFKGEMMLPPIRLDDPDDTPKPLEPTPPVKLADQSKEQSDCAHCASDPATAPDQSKPPV